MQHVAFKRAFQNKKEKTSYFMHHFKLFIRIKTTQEEKMRFIKGNKLKLTEVELLPFFFFLRK